MDIVVAIIGALILLSIIAYRFWRGRRGRKAVEEFGLNPEEFALVQRDIQRGDQEAAQRRIAAAQERLRAEFQKATGIDVQNIVPEIGREISWADIVRQVFRVCEFDKTGTKIGQNGQIYAASPVSPYGYLLVESPILNQRVKLPIIHRDDFLLAASVFDDLNLIHLVAEEDLLVTYAPKHLQPNGMSGSPYHVLHYAITPHGTLDRYYAVNNDVHMRNPAPEKIFGSFVYEGEIKVQINQQPNL